MLNPYRDLSGTPPERHTTTLTKPHPMDPGKTLTYVEAHRDGVTARSIAQHQSSPPGCRVEVRDSTGKVVDVYEHGQTLRDKAESQLG